LRGAYLGTPCSNGITQHKVPQQTIFYYHFIRVIHSKGISRTPFKYHRKKKKKNDVEYFKNGMPTPTDISFFEIPRDFVHSINVN
jgi:hypothetical protein